MATVEPRTVTAAIRDGSLIQRIMEMKPKEYKRKTKTSAGRREGAWNDKQCK
jgi:hypothetical protein